MTHDLTFSKLSSVKQQTAALQNTSFCTHYVITYESCFTGKVNTYSCERTMKEYVHGLFTTEVEINSEHQTVRSCILLSRSVKISWLQAELTAIVIEKITSFTFYKPQWFKICFLDFIMIKKCCGNDVAAFAKLSHVTLY